MAGQPNTNPNIDEKLVTSLKTYNDTLRETKSLENTILESKWKILEAVKKTGILEAELAIAHEDEKKTYEDEITNQKKIMGGEKAHLLMSEYKIELTKKRLALERSSLGTLDKMKLSWQGIREAAKEFDFARMQGSFRNTMYIFDLIEKHVGKISIEWAIAWSVLKKIVKSALEIDETLTSFRKQMGYFKGEEEGSYKLAKDIAVQYAHLGVSLDSSLQAINSLGQAQGGIYNVQKDLVTFVSLMSSQLGVGADETTMMMKNFAVMRGGLMEGSKSSVLLAREMSRAAGVSFNVIASDIAGITKDVYTLGSRLPQMLAATAIKLRQVGTDLDTAAKASRHILDFQTSMNEEMNASVLLGRSVSFQRARELAYHRDIAGSNAEILRQAKAIGFATNLDVFQMEAFASASGYSVETLMSMVQASTEQEHALRMGGDRAREMNKEFQRLKNLNEANAKATAKSAEHILQTKMNAELMTNISNSMSRIWLRLGAGILPAVAFILTKTADLLDLIGKNLTISATAAGALYLWWKRGISPLLQIQKIWGGIGTAIKYVGSLFSRIMPFVGRFSGEIGSALRGLIAGLGRIGGLFVRILNPLGKILGAFLAGWYIGKLINKLDFVQKSVQWFFLKMFDLWDWTTKLPGKAWSAIASFATSWWKEMKAGAAVVWSYITSLGVMYFGNMWSNIKTDAIRAWKAISGFAVDAWNSITYGLKETGKAIYHTLADPFIEVWGFVKGLWGGNSPSKVGLSILEGIKSIGSLIFDALTSPFHMAFKVIGGLIGGTKNVASKVWGGVKGLFTAKPSEKAMVPEAVKNKAVENKSPSLFNRPTEVKAGMSVPVVSIKPNAMVPSATETNAPAKVEKPKKEPEPQYDLGDIYNELCKLNANLMSGKIQTNTHLDGQLVSATLARQTEFKGGYGTNKV